MEADEARRRINLIAGHFTSTDNVSASHVLPMNCSGTTNSVVRRCDGRVYFARQGSDSQACFMKQVSIELSDVPFKSSASANEGSDASSEVPMFSRPSRTESNAPIVFIGQDPPYFSRPAGISGRREVYPKNIALAPESVGKSWLRGMYFAESEDIYAVTVELPGIGINDLRVEVNDDRLMVVGKRWTPWFKVTRSSNGEIVSTYHERGNSQEQCLVEWALPVGASKGSVSAEFRDGALRLIIPKL